MPFDLFRVNAPAATRSVAAREIVDGFGGDRGQCAPAPGQFKGKPFRVKAQDGGFKVGRHWRFKRAKLEEWLTRQEADGQPRDGNR